MLRQPACGHGLLIGVGGSGRRSLCKLALFMSDGVRDFELQASVNAQGEGGNGSAGGDGGDADEGYAARSSLRGS